MTETHCAIADSDTPSRYVAEALPVPEAEVFEEHYFACSRCWQEVQTGSAVRVLLHPERGMGVAEAKDPQSNLRESSLMHEQGSGSVDPSLPPPATLAQDRGRPWWISLAAAAAVVAAIALVAIRDRALRDRPDVLRGESQPAITVVAQRTAAQLQIRWRAVARASRYEIAVRSAEGEVLQQKSSTAPAIDFDGVSDRDVFIRVTAYDAQGEEIARSPFVRVSSR